MIQLYLVLGLAAALVFGIPMYLASVRAEGYEQCKADHTEAARMAQLRRREIGDAAAVAFDIGRNKRAARELAVAPAVASAVADPVHRNVCISDDGLRILADDLAQRGGAGQPAPAVPAASKPR